MKPQQAMMSDEPTTPRSKIGLILGVVWLVALMIALSGQCIAKPDYVKQDIGLNPNASASTNGTTTPSADH